MAKSKIKAKKRPTYTGDVLVEKFPLRLTVEERALVDRLRKEAARLWNDILDVHWWLYDAYHYWSDASNIKLLFNAKTHKLHSQTIQAIIELHEETNKRTSELRKNGYADWKYPWRYKGYFSVKYKQSAIKEVDGRWVFSNGKNEVPLKIKKPAYIQGKVHNAEIVWHKNGYWLHVAVEKPKQEQVQGDKIAGGDLGIIHAITVSDGETHRIFTGRHLRSLHRLRNKTLGKLQSLIARKKKGSNARYKLILRKRRFLEWIDRQIEYAEHSLAKQVVSWCLEHGVKVLYIGDPNGIQTNTKKNPKKRRKTRRQLRQELSNWSFGELVRKISYKAALHGIVIERVNEAYTSGTCPVCGTYRKQSSRNFKCLECGATGHRDVVGASNIRDIGIHGEITKGRVIPQAKQTTYRRVLIHPIKARMRSAVA